MPGYRRHKASGQAIVTLRLPGGIRHDVYLGPYRTKVKRLYGRSSVRDFSPLAFKTVRGSMYGMRALLGSHRPLPARVPRAIADIGKRIEALGARLRKLQTRSVGTS